MQRPAKLAFSGLKFAIELSLAAGVVFGVIWGLARLAEWRQNLPIRPAGDGTVSLAASRAALHGQLQWFPMDLERQTEGYGNRYGRELAQEREGRKIGDWSSINNFAEWRFRLNQPGDYEVDLEVAAPDDAAGGEFRMMIGSHTLSGKVPATGGWDRWKTLCVGRVELPAGPHILTIRPESIRNHSLMNLARVTLRPVEPSADGTATK